MASRRLVDLHPDVEPLARRFLGLAHDEEIDVLITCTWRSGVEQAQLYAIGRTTPGRIVTNAKPGESLHNILLNGNPASRAFDMVPMVFGKTVWDPGHQHWQALGRIGKSVGLKWGGDWKKRDMPHLELPEVT